MSISCFLPCRKGSERVVRKNIKPFAGVEHGLIQIKLAQLEECHLISEVVLSTNDEEIIKFAKSLPSTKLRVHRREDELSSSSTSTDDLVALAKSLVTGDDILWTHVTSPFFTADCYTGAIERYFEERSNGFDSLMSVKEIHGFLWDRSGPINYDRSVEKWPRTQTLKTLYEVDSAVFISSRNNYERYSDRIGPHPFLHVSSGSVGFDIDWPEDFALGEAMFRSGTPV